MFSFFANWTSLASRWNAILKLGSGKLGELSCWLRWWSNLDITNSKVEKQFEGGNYLLLLLPVLATVEYISKKAAGSYSLFDVSIFLLNFFALVQGSCFFFYLYSVLISVHFLSLQWAVLKLSFFVLTQLIAVWCFLVKTKCNKQLKQEFQFAI